MLNYQIITSEGATIASTVTYLLPIVVIIMGVLVLGEHITVLIPAGIALILIGVVLTRERRAERTPAGTDEHDLKFRPPRRRFCGTFFCCNFCHSRWPEPH